MCALLRALAATTTIGLLMGAGTGCGDGSSQFSQRPGFDRWYQEYPPSASIPSASDQELLERYRPRIHLSADSEGPISFYHDYIAHGELSVDGEVNDSVTPATLNAVRHRPEAKFVHIPATDTPSAAIYGRIDRETLSLLGDEPWTYLTYTLVFRYSGLPAGLPTYLEHLLELVGDLDDWHQLDNYISVIIALDEKRQPAAVTLQQHNYTRTHLLGPRDGPGILRLPTDGRLEFDVAIRSNELYPHQSERTRRRTVSFMNLKSARYLIDNGPKPMLAADDITDPGREIDPPLCYLPPADAFYTFRGWLGELRLLPGASGPPGADFNTLPAFKPRGIQMVASHWWEGDTKYLEVLADESITQIDADNVVEFARPLAERFNAMHAQLMRQWSPPPARPSKPPVDECPEPMAG